MVAPHSAAQWFFTHPLLFCGFLGAIFSAILQIVSDVVKVVETFGKILWHGIEDAVSGIARGLGWVFNKTKNLFEGVFHSLAHLFNDITQKILIPLYDDYQKLKCRLRQWFDPLIKVLNKVHQIYQKWVQPIFRGFINTIQRFRKALAFLRILHVGWAAKLDQELQQIEAKGISIDRQILGYINEAAAVLNDLLDPARLIRAVPFLRSLDQALNAAFEAFTGKSFGEWLRGEAQVAAQGLPAAPFARFLEQYRQELPGNTGEFGSFRQGLLRQRDSIHAELKTGPAQGGG